MNILDRLLFLFVSVSVFGTLMTSLFSIENQLQVIGFQEMKDLKNVSKINVASNHAYLFTYNDTNTDILQYKYRVGNSELFNRYLQNVTENEINIEYVDNVNIYKSFLYNLPSILFLYIMLKSLSNQMEMFSGKFSQNLNKTVKTQY